MENLNKYKSDLTITLKCFSLGDVGGAPAPYPNTSYTASMLILSCLP